jgi:hypothetical protein
MDCNTARLLLALAKPNSPELDAGEADALSEHLAACSDCKALARSEQAFDDTVGALIQNVSPPPDGVARLRQRLQKDRRLLYRRWYVHRAREVAAAAAVLLLAWWGYSWWQYAHRPSVDVDALAWQIASLRSETTGPAQQEQWFRQTFGVHTVLPSDLNYAYLTERTLSHFKGRAVPELIFWNGPNYARVRVLSGKDFNLAESMKQSGSAAAGLTIEIRPHPSNPGFPYLVEYNAASLDWLILNSQPPTL